MNLVGENEHVGAETLQEIPRGIELKDGRYCGAGATVIKIGRSSTWRFWILTASIGYPNRFTVIVDGHSAHGSPRSPVRKLTPWGHAFVRIGKIIRRLSVSIVVGTSCTLHQKDDHDDQMLQSIFLAQSTHP